jgi:two-component system sensor histidine kinase QseC
VELIANAARACGAGGSVTIRLKYHSGRATLTVTHSGPPSGERQLSALLQQDGDYLLPLPGQGAGLGMSVVRQIVNLHEGSMLVEWSDGAPTVVVSLPTGPLPGRLPLESPRFSMGAGLHPTLVGLADLLPAEVFGEEGLD